MTRRTRYDEDIRRLPDGMKRVGYNSISQRYTFQDQHDGTFWLGREGERYGELVQIRADEIETDTPIEKVFGGGDGEGLPPVVVGVGGGEGPPATDFEDILKDVHRSGKTRKMSTTTALSSSNRGLSQRWKGALGFASATAKLITGSEKRRNGKSLLEEVERRIGERLRQEKGEKRES
ncbi:hypothetical protein EG328_009096 [Venturia inaequalis]|uniref:Uncharacterized protein n=1 Tax=Venturia inaequalis TaxID=5025 RepID=A0A8H3YQ75_VENIN|nr:hypothetical protein EG328_009096 [Venturia inaequalis]